MGHSVQQLTVRSSVGEICKEGFLVLGIPFFKETEQPVGKVGSRVEAFLGDIGDLLVSDLFFILDVDGRHQLDSWGSIFKEWFI